MLTVNNLTLEEQSLLGLNENILTQKEEEKYSYDNLLKNKQKAVENMPIEQEHTEMIEYKEPKWYQKLFGKKRTGPKLPFLKKGKKRTGPKLPNCQIDLSVKT